MVSLFPENIVSPHARIGENVKIGKYTIVDEDVVIEDDVEIGNFCVVSRGTRIGRGTKIKNYVEIRDNTFIGENCYVDSQVAFSGQSIIGDNVTLRYGVIIARGVRVGNNSYIAPRVMTNNLDQNQNQIGGAHIGADCFVGTNAVLQHGICLGDRTTIGTLAFVNKDCDEGEVYVGIPAKKLNS